MAHSHDRTLVQQLGADLDHKTPAHDAACLYLQQKAKILAEKYCLDERQATSNGQLKDFDNYFDRVVVEGLKLCHFCSFSLDRTDFVYDLKGVRIESVKTSLEELITKGIGQYQTHIGFLDLVIQPEIIESKKYRQVSCSIKRVCYKSEHKSDNVFTFQYPGRSYEVEGPSKCLVIEVKTIRCPIGDLIRQIKLYRQYYKKNHVIWIVATTYPLNDHEIEALRNESIHTIRIHEEYAAVLDGPGAVPTF